MKILNIILSVFIFLFAAASAVFSYFLFEKRAQFVSGHEKMARAIYESSKALDAGSGTEEAKKLDRNALAHDKYAELDNVLKVLPKQSAAIVAQRDSMADAVYRVAGAVGMKDGDADAYKVIEGADDRVNKVVGAVKTVVTRRDNAYKAIIDIANEYSVKIDKNALVNASSKSASEKAFAPLKNHVDKVVSDNNNYSNAMREILKTVGGKGGNDIANVKKAVSAKVAEIKKLQSDLKAAKTAADEAVKAKDKAEKAKDKAEKAAKKVAASLADYKTRIGVSKEFKEWTKEEALERLYGKVTGVSNDYGFFVVDLGKTSVVYQNDPKDKTKKTDIKLDLAEDMEVMILRPSADTADPKSWFEENGAVISSV